VDSNNVKFVLAAPGNSANRAAAVKNGSMKHKAEICRQKQRFAEDLWYSNMLGEHEM
jgi:hypothetical protein